MPTPGQTPSVQYLPGRAPAGPGHIELVPHRHGRIGLVVAPASHERDHMARHELTNEDDGPTPRSVLGSAANVEPEIDLVEVSVEGHRQAEHPRVQEAEPDDARHGHAAERIELGAGR